MSALPSELSGAGLATPPSLQGRTIGLLEARRSAEIARLVEIQGGRCYLAPTLREVPVEDVTSIEGWLDQVAAGRFDVVIFLTGVGCQALLGRAKSGPSGDAVLAGLAAAKVVARGPKPVKVLKEFEVRIDFVPPEPNTSDELLTELRNWGLKGKRLGLQLYGGETPFLGRLRQGLADQGAEVAEVAPYRWEGPADEQPVRNLIDACIGDAIDGLAIFSSSQIHTLFAIAEEFDLGAQLAEALNRPRLVVAAIGPVTADAIASHGVKVDLVPEHPKMGHLILALGPALAARS